MRPKKKVIILVSNISIAALVSNTAMASVCSKDFYSTFRYGFGILGNGLDIEYSDDKKHTDDKNYKRDINNPWHISLELGKKFNRNLSIGISFDHFGAIRYMESKTGDVRKSDDTIHIRQSFRINSIVTTFNLHPNFEKLGKVQPYIAIGIGAASIRAGDVFYDISRLDNSTKSEFLLTKKAFEGKKQINLAWSAAIGISYKLTHTIDLELIQYRYQNFGAAYTKQDSERERKKSKIRVHSISAGIKLKF